METVVTERPNGDITTYQCKNGFVVTGETKIKTGGRIRVEIANPERWEKNLDNFYKSMLEKRKIQSDEMMKSYESFSQRHKR